MFDRNSGRYRDALLTFTGDLPEHPLRRDWRDEADILAVLLKKAFTETNTPARVAMIDREKGLPLQVTLEIPTAWHNDHPSSDTDPATLLKERVNTFIDGLLIYNKPIPQVASVTLV